MSPRRPRQTVPPIRVGRPLLLAWAMPVVAVLVLALAVGALGGFRPAQLLDGPTARLDDRLDLRRWTVVVHDVALVDTGLDGYEQDPAFRVHATVTLRDTATEASLPDLIEVRLPDGPQPGSASSQDWTRGVQMDPDVPRSMVLDYRWPDRQNPKQLPAPAQVVIIVRDEVRTRSYLSGEGWGIGPPAGVIAVPVDDERTSS